MKLFTNGCSFTWGGAIYPSIWDNNGNPLDFYNSDELNIQRINSLWPYHLSQHLNCDHVNLSIGSGSNDRIVRTTLDYFTQLLVNGQFTTDWVAIIQWTQSPRFEYWDDEAECWAMCLPTGSMTESKTDYSYRCHIDKLKNKVYSYYNNKTYSEKFFHQICTLANFFNRYKIKYWFTSLDTDAFKHLQKHQFEYVDKHLNWLNGPTYNFQNFVEDFHSSGSGHPSLLGHQNIAKNIYNMISEQI
jgi:hypothetical protein